MFKTTKQRGHEHRYRFGGSILSLERNQNQNAGNVNPSEFCVSVERTNKLQGKTNSK